MREVSIKITCDACGEEVLEDVEGSSTIVFIVSGEEWELDLCDECVHGSFLQEARRVTTRRKQGKQFACGCGKAFNTARGLSAHQTRASHG